ncbi:MAG: O-antigen ligase family protein [Gaiellaceae bacterium]
MRAAFRGARTGSLVPAFTAAILLLCVLFSGGANDGRLVGIGSPALVGAGLVLAGALVGRLPAVHLGVSGGTLVGALGALAIWMGLSVIWSVEPDRSWDYTNRTLVYLALAVLGMAAGAALGARAARLAAAALTLALALAVLWALAGKVIPALDPVGDRVGRLRGTLDYWNAFALLAASALPLALWAWALDSRRTRLAGALLGYGAIVALLLTFSRGGLLAATAGVSVWVLVSRQRFPSLVGLAVSWLPALAVSAVAFGLPGISRDDQPREVRVDDGLVFGIVLALGAILVLVVANAVVRRAAPLSPARRRLVVRGIVVAMVAAAGISLAVAIARGPSEPLTIDAGAGRFIRLGSSDRWHWWTEAWAVFRERPAAGSGAGTFDVARRPFRENESVATEPHSVPLQFLSELGLVGLALLLAAAAAAALAARKALSRLEGGDRLAAAALASVLAAFALHALLEIDWDYVALTGPAALLAGVLAACAQPAVERRRSRLSAIAAGLAGLAAALSLVTPWLADRKVDDARQALDAGRFADAARLAKDAHELNPLDEQALLQWAFAEELSGHGARAGRLFDDATALQPENPDTWRARGAFELAATDVDAAARSLTRARGLDPHDRETQRLLDRILGEG